MQNKIQLNSYSGAEVPHIINLKHLKANLFFYNCKRCQKTIFVYEDNIHICVYLHEYICIHFLPICLNREDMYIRIPLQYTISQYKKSFYHNDCCVHITPAQRKHLHNYVATLFLIRHRKTPRKSFRDSPLYNDNDYYFFSSLDAPQMFLRCKQVHLVDYRSIIHLVKCSNSLCNQGEVGIPGGLQMEKGEPVTAFTQSSASCSESAEHSFSDTLHFYLE